MMNKKTGNIITAVVLGLLMLWLTQHVFAQSPELEECGHVYVNDYDDSDLNISAIEGVTVTLTNPENLFASYPAYATVGPVSWAVNGQDKSGVPLSLFFEKPVYPNGVTGTVVITTAFGAWNDGNTLNGFVLISSTGFYLPDTQGITISATQEYALSDLWQIGPTDQTADGTLMRERFEFTGITGDVIGVKIVAGNQWGDNTEVYVGRWEAEGWCEKEQGGGAITCTTVTDADFDGLIGYEQGGWNIDGPAISIHDGYLDIDTTDWTGYSFQPFTPTQRTYTATMRARSGTSDPSAVYLSIVELEDLEARTAISVTNGVNTDFEWYTATITSTVRPGRDGKIQLYIPQYNGIQIDYLCVAPDNGICANPSQRNYIVTNDPTGFGYSLSEWIPVKIDDSMESPEYILSDWEVLLGVKTPGWHIGKFLQLPIFDILRFLGNLFTKSANIVDNLEDFVDGDFFTSVALKMPSKAALDKITIDYTRIEGIKAVRFVVMAKVDGEWQNVGESGSAFLTTAPPENAEDKEENSIEIELQEVGTAAEYTLVAIVAVSPALPFSSRVVITGIETLGCYSGDYYGGPCVVFDPTLDGGEGGKPDSFFWRWSANARPEPGGIYLTAENRDYLSQKVFAPVAGPYQLTVELLNDSSDRCELYARGADESNLVEDDFFNILMPCTTSLVTQSLTVDVNLPTDPFEFILTANRGMPTVLGVCFHAPDSNRCINTNPDFTNGATGYDGSFLLENGHIVANPAGDIYAIPISSNSFYSGDGPWVLEVTASPVVSDDTVVTAITPGINAYDTTNPANHYFQVTDTQILTYSFGKTTGKETTALIESGNGPSIYNNDADGRLHISRYCLMTDTGQTWWGGRDCTSLTNPDFELGLTGWTNSNVVPAGTFAVFDTNGHVSQLASHDNIVLNGHFDAGISGWISARGDTLSSDTGHSGSGLKVINAGVAAMEGRYNSVTTTPNTNYTFFAMVKAGSGMTGTLYVGLYTAGNSTIVRELVTANGEWASYTGTGNSGSNSVLTIMIYCSSCVAGDTVYVDDVAVVQGDSIPLQYVEPAEATVHWIARSGVPSELVATVSVSSSNGVFTTSQTVGPTLTEFYTPFEIGGDAEVTVASADPGLELDFVCLHSGTYTDGPSGPGGPGTPPWVPGVGDGRCAPPPMVVLSTTLTSWMPNIWIWSNQPTNYEVVATYSAAWLRYIGCTLSDMQLMLANKLDTIISKLGSTSNGWWADAIARIFEALADMVEAIAGIISQLLTLIISIWNALAPGLGLLWELAATLLSLFQMMLGLLTDFATWLLQMVMILANMMLGFITDSATVPGEAFTAWNNAINDPAYEIIPLQVVPSGEVGASATVGIDCTYPESNNWCMILFGFQVVNQTIGSTILYPIVIIGLIVSTIFVFRNQLWDYYNMKLR